MTPEQKARVRIDELLAQAGWHVCDLADADIHAGPGEVKGVAIREFPLNPGHGFADYLLYVNGKACGVIEAKKEGATLTGVELQLGQFVSMPGYSSVAISQASKPRSPLMLMDVTHVFLSLQGLSEFPELISCLRQHASQTSEAHLPASRCRVGPVISYCDRE